MTRKEIEKLPFNIDMLLSESLLVDTKEQVHKKITEVCSLAIKALEQEPCEDCQQSIRKSKYMTRKEIKEMKKRWREALATPTKPLHDPVPLEYVIDSYLECQESCEDAISRQAVNALIDELARAISDERCCISRGRDTATIMQEILDLPSIQPKPKTGHWKKLNVGYRCSECSLATNESGVDFYRFCPNCGARMSESKYVAEWAESFAQGLRPGLQDGFAESEEKDADSN